MSKDFVEEFKEEVLEILNGHTLEELTEYFKKVDKLRRSIIGRSSLFERLNEHPNCFYGVVPFDGSLVVCENYGNLNRFYTPLGKWSITGGGCNDGKSSEDILKELGIKYTRLTDQVAVPNGVFGGIIQIDEDQFGNIYPEFNKKYLINTDISTNGELAKVDFKLANSFGANRYLFDLINTDAGGEGDLLRKERNNGI